MSIGSLVALPVVPYIADGLGRRWGIMIGCLIMILGVILQTISINLKMFIAARFFLGFGIAIAHGASPLLVTELVHPQHRATFGEFADRYIIGHITHLLTISQYVLFLHVPCELLRPCHESQVTVTYDNGVTDHLSTDYDLQHHLVHWIFRCCMVDLWHEPHP